jgi:hypothetical protein
MLAQNAKKTDITFAMPRSNASLRVRRIAPEHPFEWLAEPLKHASDFELKAWFGGRTVMLRGKHQLYLSAQGEPWQGVLVCTAHEHQTSLRAEFPALEPHPILKKWLYLPERHENFEQTARRLIDRVRGDDPRIGIAPSPRKARKRKAVRFGDTL